MEPGARSSDEAPHGLPCFVTDGEQNVGLALERLGPQRLPAREGNVLVAAESLLALPAALAGRVGRLGEEIGE